MFLKLFLFAIVVKCLVLASQEEPNESLINDSSNDASVDSPIINDLELLFADIPTKTPSNETEISGSIIENLTEATTVIDNSYYDNDNSSNNATDSTGTEGENTLAPTVTDELTVVVSDPPSTTVSPTNETEVTSLEPEITIPSTTVSPTNETEATSHEPEVTVPSTTVSPTNETEGTSQEPEITNPSTTASSINETETISPVPEITNPSTTVSPTIETEVTTLEPETTIDPKYRNESFELHMQDFMRNNPSAVRIQSPGFPRPYGNNLNETFNVTLTNCTGIDVVIHYLNLNPFVPDTLNIRGGHENATNEVGRQFTGVQYNIVYKIIHTTSLFIRFETGAFNDEYQGFVLTYSPYGDDTPKTTTTEAPVTIPPAEIQNFEVLLVLSAENRTNETWKEFKDLLANSASKYVLEQNVHVQTAHPDNVTIAVFECPHNWPNYKTCIRLQFSISLWDQDYDPEVDFDFSEFDYELSTVSLSAMWDLYGKYDFLEVLGIEEYSAPDGTYVLLLWTGVSLSIVVIFIGVLYSIWRIDIFREYRRMYTKNDDQQDILKSKSELDVSMYPTPHQPYPTLFETSETNAAGYYDSNEMNSSSFHNFHLEMQQEKSSTPSNYRQATSHFSPNLMDLDSPFFTLDDEDDIKPVPTLSPRSKQRLLVLGAKRDESTT